MSELSEWRAAYIDETGDRGDTLGTVSPIFGMASVIMGRAAEQEATMVVRELKESFGLPDDKVLSWKRHINYNHSRARHAAASLSEVAGLSVVYSICIKADIDYGQFHHDRRTFYDTMAYETMRLTLNTAKYGMGMPLPLRVKFGYVKDHDPEPTREYLKRRFEATPQAPTDILRSVQWQSAGAHPCHQVADLYAGFLKAAYWPDPYGRVEGSYLTQIWDQIRKQRGCVLPFGIYTQTPASLRKQPWWPCKCSVCMQKAA